MNAIEQMIVNAAKMDELAKRLTSSLHQTAAEGRPILVADVLLVLAEGQSALASSITTLAVQLDRVHRGVPILDDDTGLALVPPADGPDAA